MSDQKITSDTILHFLKDAVESKKILNPSLWGDSAFKLNLLLGDEHNILESLRQDVAKMRLEILQKQDKKNVAACDVEVGASDLFRLMRLQEHKVGRVEEFIKLAKKNMSQF